MTQLKDSELNRIIVHADECTYPSKQGCICGAALARLRVKELLTSHTSQLIDELEKELISSCFFCEGKRKLWNLKTEEYEQCSNCDQVTAILEKKREQSDE